MNNVLRFHLASFIFVILTFLIFPLGCQSPGKEMTTETRDELVKEITDLMEAYSGAVKTWNMEAIDRFWGDFGGFIFAGDGIILGSHDEWSETLRQYEDQVDRWLKFEYKNMHVEVLSVDAAPVTTEFEHSRVTVNGDTINVKGAWTYVFKKSNGEWDIVHTNGTHVEF